MDNWVLIPCHNNSSLLVESLKTILSQDIGNVKIFAINNDSKDNTAFVLKDLDNSHVVVYRSPQSGVSGAWNFGLSCIFGNEKAEKVLVVNQDIILRPDTYRILDEQNLPFVSAVSRGSSELTTELAVWANAPIRPHPDFSCFLIRKDCYQRVGPFDEQFYPAWFEDNDYHIRAARAGIELVCIDLPFYHYAAATMKLATEYDKAHYYGPAFLRSKQRFQDKWGVLPGTKEYEEMCSPSFWTSASKPTIDETPSHLG